MTELTRDDLEVREITVKIRMTDDPNRSENLVEFYVGNCDVKDGNELIGSIKAGFGANVTVFTHGEDHQGWTLYADDLWYAVQEQIINRKEKP